VVMNQWRVDSLCVTSSEYGKWMEWEPTWPALATGEAREARRPGGADAAVAAAEATQ
jgi:hypothetical protein